ncbi:MAG: hypothetical protein ACLP19_20730 [Xanthobacteraceae bacterium]
MSLRAVSGYECLAHEKSDPAITPDLSNQLINQSQPEEANVSQTKPPPARLPPKQVPQQLPKSMRGSLRRQSSAFVSFEDHVAYTNPQIRPVLSRSSARG